MFIVKKAGDRQYRFFLPFVWIAIVLLLGLAFWGFHLSGWTLKPFYFMECEELGGCVNDYYNSLGCLDSVYSDTPLCTQPSLVFGESIGVRPPFIVAYSLELSFAILFLWLFLNHFFFNKGFFKGWKYDFE
jgi:hypothetical protein